MTISSSVLIADNAFGTLASGLASTDLTLTFTTGHGARFPAVASGQVLNCCILNSSNVLEELHITLHTVGSDTATITRAANGTTAKAWSAGDRIEARISSEVLKQLQNEALKETTITTADSGATYTGTMSPAHLGYVTGLVYALTLTTTNNGTAPTVALNGLAAITVKLNGSVALVAGHMPKNGLYKFDGTNFVLLNPTSPGASKYVHGFTYANSSGDVTNDIDIAAGVAAASDGGYWITGAAITKQLDAAWAVGTGAGGLDTGAIGNSDYYIWAIARSDTGVVDALFSLSSTAPTMPTSYDFKRLIGWFKRVGGAIVLFHTYETEGGGIEQNWDGPTLDVNITNTLTTARRTDAVKVPLNFSVIAHLNVSIEDNTQARIYAWICCPDQNDGAPSISLAPLSNVLQHVAAAGGANQMFIRTSATGTIAARADLATVDLYAVSTMGFRWARRN